MTYAKRARRLCRWIGWVPIALVCVLIALVRYVASPFSKAMTDVKRAKRVYVLSFWIGWGLIIWGCALVWGWIAAPFSIGIVMCICGMVGSFAPYPKPPPKSTPGSFSRGDGAAR